MFLRYLQASIDRQNRTYASASHLSAYESIACRVFLQRIKAKMSHSFSSCDGRTNIVLTLYPRVNSRAHGDPLRYLTPVRLISTEGIAKELCSSKVGSFRHWSHVHRMNVCPGTRADCERLQYNVAMRPSIDTASAGKRTLQAFRYFRRLVIGSHSFRKYCRTVCLKHRRSVRQRIW